MPSAGQIIRASDVAVQGCRVTHDTAQSIADNAEAVVAFDNERFDTDTMHNSVTNNSRITINTAGIYTVGFNGRFAPAADYVRCYAILRLNGVTEIASSPLQSTSTSVRPVLMVNTVYQFAATDYVEVKVFQDNSANVARDLEKIGSRSPEFYAARIGS